MISVPFTYQSQVYAIQVPEIDTVQTLYLKIASELSIQQFNLYYRGSRLYPSVKISDCSFQQNSKSTIKVIPSLSKRSIVLGSDLDSRSSILQRYLDLILSTTDSIGNALIAETLLNLPKGTPICDLFSKSVASPEISTYIYSLFQRDIVNSMSHKVLSQFYCICTDIPFLGKVMNDLAKHCQYPNKSMAIIEWIENIKIDSKFFELLKNCHFSNQTYIYEAIFSRILKEKDFLFDYSTSLVVFINNSTLNDTNFFQKLYQTIKDKKFIKSKPTTEIKLLLLSLSIHAEQLQDVTKKNVSILSEMVTNLKCTKAIISILYSLLQYSKSHSNFSIVTYGLMKRIFDKLPNEYPHRDIIYQLFFDRLDKNDNEPLPSESSNDQQLSFSTLLLFSSTFDFHLIWPMKQARLWCHTSKFADLIKSNFSYIELYNSIISTVDPSNPKSTDQQFKSIFNIITSTLLNTKSLSAPIPTGRSYYDSLFNLLLLLTQSMGKISIDGVKSIVQFAFLYLLRPDLTLQKDALHLLSRIDDLFELKNQNKAEVCIHQQIINLMDDPSFADLNESCRIFRAALSFYSRSSPEYKTEIYRYAILIGSSNMTAKGKQADSVITLPEKSYTVFILKIVSKQIEPNIELYSKAIQARLEFISIAFSFFWSISGSYINYSDELLTYLSQTKSLNSAKKLDVLFRFIQKENKKEQRHLSCPFITNSPTFTFSATSDWIKLLNKKKNQPSDSAHSNNSIQPQGEDEENEEEVIKKKICDVITHLVKPNFSEGYSIQCFKYFFILSRLITDKSFFDFCMTIFGKENVLLIDTELQWNETIRHFFFMILVSINDERAFFLLPQINEEFLVEYIKAHHENKKVFIGLLRNFLIYNEKTLKKAILMGLSLKFSSIINLNDSIDSLLKANSSMAIPTLFLILSNSRISRKESKKVITLIAHFLSEQLPLNSKIVSKLMGATNDNLLLLYQQTRDYLVQYLPLFLINDVFDLEVWKKIAERDHEAVLNSIVSAFSESMMDLNPYQINQPVVYFQNKMKFTGQGIPQTAYRLFEEIGTKEPESWQVIVLSLLFDKPNEFVNNHLLKLLPENDILKSVQKSAVSALFEHPIEELLPNDPSISKEILRVLPCVRSMKKFTTLFDILVKSTQFDQNDLKLGIKTYSQLHPSLVTHSSFVKFIIEKINDIDVLHQMLKESNSLIRQQAYEKILKINPDFQDELVDQLVKEGKLKK